MERRFRLRRASDIQRVRQSGRSYAHPLLVLVARRSDSPGPRLAVSAGRSVGGAVLRNRARRRLRAAVHPWLAGLRGGWDLLVIARPGLGRARWEEVQGAVRALLRRAELIDGDDPQPPSA